jgi:6-phospho-3-hexuloisomerase
MRIELQYDKVLSEISNVLESSNFDNLEEFSNKILKANKIIVFGAGRVGLMMKSFAMRLSHLSLEAYFLGEVNVPRTEKGDLMIIGSGSGNTKTVVTVAEIAKNKGLEVVSITSNPESVIAKLSSSIVNLNCETKDSKKSSRLSIQPMTTLFEQSLLIFLDSLILILMNELQEDHDSMIGRHNVIE